jgi:hypothetical protein
MRVVDSANVRGMSSLAPAETTPEPPGARWRRRAHWTQPPAIAYAFSVALYTLIAWLSGENFFSVASHHRWDSGHYKKIAEDGFEMFRCVDVWPDYPAPDQWCGNTGWFPLFPMLMRAGSALGFRYELAGVFITEAAFFGVLCLLWWLLGARLTPANALCLALAAVVPGSIYMHALFPMAIGTFGLLLAVVGLTRGSWKQAGVGGAIACASHLMGCTILGVLVASVFFAWRDRGLGERAWNAARATGLALCGLLWTFCLHWQASGRWDAYFEYQSTNYGNGLHNPIESFLNILQNGTLWFPLPADATALELSSVDSPRYTLIANTIFLLLALGMTAWRGVRQWREKSAATTWGLSTPDWAVALLSVAIYLLPLVAGGMVTPYRNHVMLLPAVLLLRDAPRVVQLGLFALFVWDAALLGAAFYSVVLV